MRDDGLGVAAALTIRRDYSIPPGLEVIDGGTLGLDLLPALEGFEKVIFLDAVDFGKEPGYVGVLEDGDIHAAVFPKISAHHIGLADLLSAAMFKGVMPRKVCLIGMQPSRSEISLGLEMSDIVKANMERLIDAALSRLKAWGVELRVKDR
jgi:hydrogenase maturation protease